VTHSAVSSPARSTSRVSSRNAFCPSINRRMTWRLEMLTPTACSCVTRRSTVTWPWWYCISTKRRSSGPKLAPAEAGVAANAARQRCHDGLARRRQPALAAIAHYPRADHQVLHLVRLVAFELRAWWHRRRPQHLGLQRDPRRYLAAAAMLGPLAAGLRLRPLLHAARLDGRPTLQPFQSRDLIALRRHGPIQLRHPRQ